VSPAGFEPKSQLERLEHSEGQNPQKAGENQRVALENRTEPELARTPKEPAKTITGYITDSTTDAGLKAVVDAWPNLSPDARNAIARIIESEKNKRTGK